MIGLFGLLFVSMASAFSMVWLIGYAPIISTFLGFHYSPRLLICRLLVPFDVLMTTIMVLGPWIAGAGGVAHACLATFTSLGLTGGTVIIRKFFVHRWRLRYLEAVNASKSLPSTKIPVV